MKSEASKQSIDLGPAKAGKQSKVFLKSRFLHLLSVSQLLKTFPESPLCDFRKTDLLKARRHIRTLIKQGGPVFVFAIGGMGAAGQIAGHSLNKKVFPVNSLNASWLDFLHSLTKTQLKNARWCFISKSGQTAENLFYISWIKKLYKKKKLSFKEGQIQLLTKAMNSPLAEAAKNLNGALFKLDTHLPGRFCFFTQSGFLQAGLTGLNLKRFSEGFLKNRFADQISEQILLFFFKFLKTGHKAFLITDPLFLSLARWFEASWSESLFKEKSQKVFPVRACNASDFSHGFLEEMSLNQPGAFVLSLRMLSAFRSLNRWEEEREKTLKRILKRKGGSCLFLDFKGDRDFLLGTLAVVFFKVIYGAGKALKVDIYSQDLIDDTKRDFLNALGKTNRTWNVPEAKDI